MSEQQSIAVIIDGPSIHIKLVFFGRRQQCGLYREAFEISSGHIVMNV